MSFVGTMIIIDIDLDNDCFVGGFIIIKHRIPEIVVPNLDGFEVSALHYWEI